jgi:hypothetical protein
VTTDQLPAALTIGCRVISFADGGALMSRKLLSSASMRRSRDQAMTTAPFLFTPAFPCIVLPSLATATSDPLIRSRRYRERMVAYGRALPVLEGGLSEP